MIGAAVAETRSRFEASRRESDPAVVAQRIAEGDDANDFIKHHIVQAKRDAKGQYVAEVDAPPPGTQK